MSMMRWLRSLCARRHDPARRPLRLGLEALEDRCLPAGGLLDPTFGSGGLVTTAVGSAVNSQAHAVATYPSAGTANDGKVVAAGYTSGGPLAYEFAVVRYNLNGTLDPSFGAGGEVSGPSGVVNDVKVEPDGKVVVAGWSAGFAVARFNADGSPDGTFGGKGSKGLVVTPIGKRSLDGAGRLALQPDGKIVVAGWTAAAGTTNYDLVLARYNADGSLDTSFGAAGKVVQHFAYPLSQTNQVSGLVDMALDPGRGPLDPNAGKIVVAAPLQSPGGAMVVRFNTNGSLDTSFGGGAGHVTSNTVPAIAVAVQSDDRIVLAGQVDGGASTGYDIGLVRLNADGSPDPTFGSGGIAVTALPGDQRARSLALQPDGKILVAGNQDYNFMVARYNGADGSLDASFGTGGVAVSGGLQNIYQPGTAIAYQAVDVALEPDGRIVLAGTQVDPSTGKDHFALARFLAAGPQVGSFTASPSSVTAGGDVTLTAGNVAALNPGSTVTRVAFYLDSNGDGVLEPGTDTLLGYGTQSSSGTWAYTFSTAGWASGGCTLFAQAQDSDGAFGDPLSLTLSVL